MSRRSADDKTLDMFQVPEPETAPSALDYRAPVSGLVGRMLKEAEGDRHEIAARASSLTGTSVTKCMLDAYASEGRETFNLPFYLVPALEAASQSLELSNWLANVRGGRLLVGRDALAGELAKLERQRATTSRQISQLRKVMEVTR